MDAASFVESDFDKICRLCLSRDRPLSCLFSHKQDNIPLFMIAQTCATVDICEDDGLPDKICGVCLETILSSYQFRQQVGRNDSILRCIVRMKSDPDSKSNRVVEEEVEDDEVSDEAADPSWMEDDPADVCEARLNNTDNQKNTEAAAEQEAGYNQRKQGDTSRSIPGTKAEVRAKLLEYGTPNSDGNSYHCKLCNKVYRKFYHHVKFKHLQISAHYCNQCDYMAPTKAGLIQHIEGRHLRVKKYKCLQCPLGFTTKQNLVNHARAQGHKLKPSSNANDPEREEVRAKMREYGTRLPNGSGYHCKPCNKVFSQFYGHVKYTHLRIRGYICDQCGYQALSKTILVRHIDGVHLRVKKYKCLDCSLFFFTQQKLTLHARTHRPGSILMCEVCGKSFNGQPNLKSHLMAQHFPELKLKCDFCDCAYASRSKLKRHLKKKH